MNDETHTPEEDTQPVKTGSLLISPVVAELAKRNYIDLNRVTGTGEEGRITKQDVLDAIRSGAARIPKSPQTHAASAWMMMEASLNRMDRSLKTWSQEQFGATALPVIDGVLAASLAAIEHFPQLLNPVGEPEIQLVRPGAETAALPQTMIDEPLSVLAARIERNGTAAASSNPAFLIKDHSQSGIITVIPALPAGQNALLAIAAPQRRPVAVSNTMVIHLMLNFTLVYDPGQVDANLAAEFLTFLKRMLEEW